MDPQSSTTAAAKNVTSKPFLSRNLPFQKRSSAPTENTTLSSTSRKRKRLVPRAGSVDDRRKLKIRKGLEDGDWAWLEPPKPIDPDLFIFAINELQLLVNGGRYCEDAWVELTINVYNNFSNLFQLQTSPAVPFRRVYGTSQIVRYSSIPFHTFAIPISKISPNIHASDLNEAFLDIVIKPINPSRRRATDTWKNLGAICPVVKCSKVVEGAGCAYLIPTKSKLETSPSERPNDQEIWNSSCYGYLKFNTTSLVLPEPIALSQERPFNHSDVICIDCETNAEEEPEIHGVLAEIRPTNRRKLHDVQRKQPSSYTTVHKSTGLTAEKSVTNPAPKKKRRTARKTVTASSSSSLSMPNPPLASSSSARTRSPASTSTSASAPVTNRALKTSTRTSSATSIPRLASSSTAKTHSTASSSTSASAPVSNILTSASDRVGDFPEECRGRFFAAGTFEPIRSLADVQHETEASEDWRIALGEYNLNDFADLSLEEKKLLNCWNKHRILNRVRGPSELPRWVLNFAKENKDTIRPIRMEFCRLLTALVSLGHISPRIVLDALRYIDT